MNELEEARGMMSAWVTILTLAAKKRKRVVIEYKYLDQAYKTTREIEPIKWEYGRTGLHVLTYSPEDKSWRRFALSHILQICVTTTDYTSSFPTQLA